MIFRSMPYRTFVDRFSVHGAGNPTPQNLISTKTYTYNAYGNPISTTGSLASTVGASNPYRYRGYYFDAETGFYYCNSRYYDPANGRWINADGMIEAGSLLPNMFMYCMNNPVNYCDPSGMLTEKAGKKEAKAGKPVAPVVEPINDRMLMNIGFSSSSDLTSEQMHVNATIAYNYLSSCGWSDNAVFAALGNMQYESRTINPGQWQIGGNPGGYGIVQWDPADRLFAWAAANNYPADALLPQLKFLVYCMQPGNGEWFNNSAHPGFYMSYNEFIVSNASVDYLTQVFLWSYERPEVGTASRRIEYANYWTGYFG